MSRKERYYTRLYRRLLNLAEDPRRPEYMWEADELLLDELEKRLPGNYETKQAA